MVHLPPPVRSHVVPTHEAVRHNKTASPYSGDAFRVVAHEFGLPQQVLAYERVEVATLEPGNVLVRMLLSPINPSDLIPVTGAYRHRTRLPFVPGYDGVGIVIGAGRDIDPAMIGRRVLPLGSAGAWQTLKVVPAVWCVDVPSDINDQQAALAYINPLTTRLLLQALSPQVGERIGITAGGSAIGRMLIRSLASIGAHPIAIVRSSTCRVALSREPADIFLEHESIPEIAAGLDAVGGLMGARLARNIQPGGKLIHYGLLSGEPLCSFSTQSDVTVQLFRLRDWVHTVSRIELASAMALVFDDIRAGRSTSSIAREFPLLAFREALTHVATPGRNGKIMLRV